MIELQLLGGARLGARSRDGVAAVLAQPRRLALLAYLSCARPPGPVSRETLTGVFWPEQTPARARASLSQALWFLRSHLGAEVLVSAGRESVGVDPEWLRCDVNEFDARLDAGDREGALALYAGDLLSGVFVNGSPEFERWLDGERDRLRRRALDAARSAAESRLARGESADAAHWLHVALRLDPCDETSLRRLVELLVAAGDRTGARRELDAFRQRLEKEFELPLPDGLEAVLESEPDPALAAGPAKGDPAPVRRAERPSIGDERPTRRPLPRRRRFWAAAGIACLIGTGVILTQPGSNARGEPLSARRVLIAPFTDLSGSPELASLGGIASDWLAQELAATGAVEVLPWTLLAREAGRRVDRGDTTAAVGSAIRLAAELGAGTVVTGSYFLRGDSVLLHARIADVRTGALVRAIEAPPVPRRDRLHALEALRSQLAGALAAVLDPRLASWSHASSQPPTFAAYRLFAAGIDAWLAESFADADSLFLAAAELDTAFTAPLVWAIRSAWQAPNGQRARELIGRLERRPAMLAPWDQAMLDYYRARLDDDWGESYRHARRLAEIAPVSEWLLLWSESAMATLRLEEALQVSRRLDYHAGWLARWPYPRRMPAQLLHLLEDYEGELEAATLMDSSLPRGADRARLRALAGSGRLQEHAALLERMSAGLDADGLYDLLSEVAGELHVHGHDAAARAAAQQRDQLLGRLTQAARPLRNARAFRAAGRFEEAHSRFLEVLEQDVVPRQVVLKDLALTAALAGDSTEALRLLDAAFADLADNEWTASETASVYAAFGDLDGAVRILREARTKGAGFYFYMHTPDGALARYPPYQALMRPRS